MRWTGIGTVGTAVLWIVLFREPATAMRLLCIALTMAGIVGLKTPGYQRNFLRAPEIVVY